MIRHEGTSSLYSLLKNKGLCSAIYFSYISSAGIVYIEIWFDLTEYGLKRVDDIINLTMQVKYKIKGFFFYRDRLMY